MAWHGVVRATGDIDFLYEPTSQNVERLCAALREFGAPPSLIDPAFLMSPNAVMQIGIPPLRIDFLAAISGPSFEEDVRRLDATRKSIDKGRRRSRRDSEQK